MASLEEILEEFTLLRLDPEQHTIILPPGVYQCPLPDYLPLHIEGYVPDEFEEAKEEEHHDDMSNDEKDKKEPEIAKRSSTNTSETAEGQPQSSSAQAAKKSLEKKKVIVKGSSDDRFVYSGQHGGDFSIKNVEFQVGLVGLGFSRVKNASVENCTFKDLKFGIAIYSGDVKIKNCEFFDTRGIYATQETGISSVYVSDCRFHGVGGVNLDGAGITIERSSFHSCTEVPIRSYMGDTVVLRDLTIENTIGLFAISLVCNEPDKIDTSKCEITNCIISGSKMHGIRIKNYAGKITNCKISRNNVGLEICRPLKQPLEAIVVEGCEIFHNFSDALHIYQHANVVIRGNSIHDNEGKGLSISSDSERVVEENVVVRNGGGDLCIKPFEEDSNKVQVNGVDSDIIQAIVERKCTFLTTGAHYAVQPYYDCLQCGFTGGSGICESCKEKCHKGHNTVFIAVDSFYCDCGAHKDCPACK